MSSIADEIIQEGAVIERECATLLERVADAAFESIVFGSEVTGSPGQPVLDGKLRDSWVQRPIGEKAVEISTDSPYAQVVEYGHQQTTNHGPFSVTKTVAGFDKLVDAEVQKMRGS